MALNSYFTLLMDFVGLGIQTGHRGIAFLCSMMSGLSWKDLAGATRQMRLESSGDVFTYVSGG